MNQGKEKDGDIVRASYEKETTERKHAASAQKTKGGHRPVSGVPTDPNALTHVNFPPGVEPEDAADPGRATPNAPPVDNRTDGKK